MPLAVAALVVAQATSSWGAVGGASALPDAFEQESLLWERELASHQYTTPVLDDGQLFVGTNDQKLEHTALTSSGGGLLQCLDPDDGTTVWQMVIPRFEEGDIPPSHFNRWKCGVCSRPAMDEKCLYIVGPRGDVLCLDRQGQIDGNDGPFKDEAVYMEAPPDYRVRKTDGDIIWAYNMVTENKVVPHDVCGSSPLLLGDYVYACTSNGQDNKHRYVVHPEAPALIVLDKRTGRLVATEAEGISERTFHCNWSSPVAAKVDGEPLVLFGGGDGVLYAFEPVSPGAETVRPLKKRWQYDCCPASYRTANGEAKRYSSHSKRTPDGPSEIISIPLVAGDRVYVPIGQSPNHGPGQGMLTCLDLATGTRIWESPEVDRTTAQPALADGLLYISDYSGKLSCLDADNGKLYWQHDLEAGAWCASPVVAGGRVYISTEKKVFWVLEAGKEKRLISRSRLRSDAITPLVQNGMFLLPTQKRLFALEAP